MNKKLKNSIIIAVAFMLFFILLVILTEKSNVLELRKSYATGVHIQNESITRIPAPTERAYDFQSGKVVIWIFRLILGFLIPVLFLFSKFSSRLRDWAFSKNKNFIIGAAIYFLIYSVIDYLINLPLDFYSGFIRLHDYGLSNQTFIKWISDSLKAFLLSALPGALFIFVPYWAIKKSPSMWWLYIGALSIPVLIFISFINPLYIDPMFNKFHPLNDKVMEEKIHQLLKKTTIGEFTLLEVDKSEDTNQMNAYMTGLFSSKRIVLWDTTLKNLTQREVLSVVAHEAGHYLLGHIWKSVLLGGLLTIVILFLVNKSAIWILKNSGGIFGFNKLHDIASIPLILLVINMWMFFASPIENGYSRYVETQADKFELRLTGDNEAGATSMVKLYWEGLSLPRPGVVYMLWNYSHPTFEDRVKLTSTYK